MNPNETDNTQRLPESSPTSTTDDGKVVSPVSTHQLTPIAGSNGYQQQIGFDLSQPLQLNVTNVNGAIKVKSSNEDTIWLVVRRNDKHDDSPLNLNVSVEGNKISIHPDWQFTSSLSGLAKKIKDQLKNGLEPGDWNLSKLRFGNDFDFDIRVEIPRNLVAGSKIALRTTSGEIDIEGVTADISTISASGSIHARDLQGTISAHTASGSIRGENIRESLEANTASGSIRIQGGEAWTALRTVSGSIIVDDFTMRNAKLASVSGTMKLDVTANNALAPYGFDTVSGSVHLNVTVPSSASGPSLSFRSISGSGNTGGAWTSSGKRNWIVGDGQGAPFKVSTVSGSMHTTATLDGTVIARNEPLPNSDRYDNDRPSESADSKPHFDIDIDFPKEDINRAVNWAKEAARRFTQPLDDQPTTPVPPVAFVEPTTASGENVAAPVEEITTESVEAPESVVETPPVATTTTTTTTSEPDTAVASTPAELPEDEEALKVLEALERGDIDVEEALARIERAENPTP